MDITGFFRSLLFLIIVILPCSSVLAEPSKIPSDGIVVEQGELDFPIDTEDAAIMFSRTDKRVSQIIANFTESIDSPRRPFTWIVSADLYSFPWWNPFSSKSDLPEPWQKEIDELDPSSRPLWKIDWRWEYTIPWYGCTFWVTSKGKLLFDRGRSNWPEGKYCKYDPRK